MNLNSRSDRVEAPQAGVTFAGVLQGHRLHWRFARALLRNEMTENRDNNRQAASNGDWHWMPQLSNQNTSQDRLLITCSMLQASHPEMYDLIVFPGPDQPFASRPISRWLS